MYAVPVDKSHSPLSAAAPVHGGLRRPRSALYLAMCLDRLLIPVAVVVALSGAGLICADLVAMFSHPGGI